MINYNIPEAILFDLDGTLINTMEGFADLAAELINKYYGTDTVQARRDYITTSGIPFKHQLEVMFPEDTRNHGVQSEFEKRKLDVFYNTHPDEDTVKAVNELREKGVKTIVSSNNYHEFVEKYFSEHNMIKFDMILGYKDGFAKGKDHINFVIEKMFLPRDRMIFVGDSLHDGDVAFELGIPFIGRIAIRTEKEFLDKFPDIKCVNKISEINGLIFKEKV